MSFIEKYRPKKTEELLTKKNTEIVLSAVKAWKKGSKPLLLYGPTGTGKTATAQVIAQELGYELIELNASEDRTGDAIKEKALSAATQRSLFGTKKIILLDEIDGLYGRTDRGAMPAVAELFEKTIYPVILTAEDAYDQRLRPIRDKCALVQYTKTNYKSVSNLLEGILKEEGIEAEKETLDAIALRSGGDIRAALIDTETATKGRKRLEKKDLDVLSARDSTIKIHDTLKVIFKTMSIGPALDVARNTESTPDEVMLWVAQNLPLEYEGEDLAKAYSMLSRADVFRGRIMKRQHWRFLAYQSQLQTAGVALAKKEKNGKFVQYQMPDILFRMGMSRDARAVRESVAGKIGALLHSSKNRVKNADMGYIRQIFANDTAQAKKISKECGLDAREVAFILSKKDTDNIVKGIMA